MRPCNSCPFLEGTKNYGSDAWLLDVMKGIQRGSLAHSCHKTDPKADGYVGHKEGKGSVCIGFLGLMKNDSFTCIDPGINEKIVDGSFDFKDVPTEGIFKSVRVFSLHHFKEMAPDLIKRKFGI